MIDLTEFSQMPHAISLLGMSGVGKTTLSKTLRRDGGWFHYSADYRIGTRYLSEPILDNVKFKIMSMEDPFVANLLRSDSIFIGHNISVDNLEPVSTFLGIYGDPEFGGLKKTEFLQRQNLYRQAEIQSMKDVPHFISKSWNIYSCSSFVNDASGSLCEIVTPDDPEDPVIRPLIDNSLILYIRADAHAEEALKERARSHPKPLFYNPNFIGPKLEKTPEDGVGINPIEFARPLFPELLEFRKPRYESMAARFGVTIDAAELFGLNTDTTPDPENFMEILYNALMREIKENPFGTETANRYITTCRTRLESRNRNIAG